MKNYYNYLIAFFLFVSVNVIPFSNLSAGFDPTFDMTVKNITHVYGNNGQDSVITFELYLQQTNQGQPGVNDFEYCCGQFTFRYNKLIHSPGGNLVLGIIPSQSELPPTLRPPSFQVDSLNGYLKASGNLPQSLQNYFISGTYPGTKILTFKARTNAKNFNLVPLNLSFKLGAAPNTFVAAFRPYPDSVDSEQFPSQYVVALMDTVVNHYSVEDSTDTPDLTLFSPAYGSTTVKRYIDFSWNNVPTAVTYKLEIASDGNFSNIVFSDSALTDTFKTVSSFNPNSFYFWRVSAKNDFAYFATSESWAFTTGTVQVVLNSPVNNAASVPLPVLFKWNNIGILTSPEPVILSTAEFDNIVFYKQSNINKTIKSDRKMETEFSQSDYYFNSNTTYKLEVSDDQNFNNIVYTDSGLTDTFKTVSNLVAENIYFWRVTPQNDSIFTASSNEWRFNTNLIYIALYSPANNSVNIPATSNFSWSQVAGALSYTLQISEDSLFNSFIFNDSTITDTSKLVSLNNGTFYSWRVIAKLGSPGNSLFSDIWKFRTVFDVAGIYPTFDLIVKNIQTYPNNSNIQDSILTFEIWMQQTNQGQPNVYDFEYASSQFAFYYNKQINSPGGNLTFGIIPQSSSLPPQLRPPSYQVDSANGILRTSANIPNSYLNYFISGSFPGTRILTCKLVTNKRIFNFVPLNLKFKLDVSTNPSRTVTSFLLPYPDSVDSQQFPNQTSVLLTDTIENHYSVEDPHYVLPVEISSFTSKVIRSNVTLNWSTLKETNNSGFDIERADLSGEWQKTGYVEGNGNSTETKNYNFSERVNSGKYNYRLKQIDFNGNVSYHNLESEVEVGAPNEYYLSQNYPNPFNPTTKIDFEMPYDSKLSLVVYDISGKEVASLVNEFRTSGYYTESFNASNLASGIYFYTIRTKDFQMTRKMVVVK